MGSMSIWHWVIVLVVVLLLFGAKRIPELASSLGSGIKNFKKSVKEDEEKPVEATATPVQTTASTEPAQQASAKPNEQTKA
ncbi:MAG: hypothetical protein RL154_1243 [Pseudomonadota bacterium]